MTDRPTRPNIDRCHRREVMTWMVATGTVIPTVSAFGQEPATTADLSARDALIRQLQEAGLEPIRTRVLGLYLGIGDAPDAFIRRALELCESLARDMLGHFRKRGFPVEPPATPMTVVVLAGPESYGRFLGAPEDEAVGGHYEIGSNRLVMFDNRGRADGGPLLERANTVVLMHEAMHQLTFNTGLLRREARVSLAIHEGLGTYAETRRPDGRVPIGLLNEPRFQVLAAALRQDESWLTVSRLLDDELFRVPATVQRAYAGSWFLVHQLLNRPERTRQFRVYLDAINRTPSDSPWDPLKPAIEAFGDLERLDNELRATLSRLVRNG